MPQWLIVAGAVATALLAIGGVIRMWVAPLARRTNEFLDDWFGQPARPGVPSRPGVPERLASIESAYSEVRSEVGAIKARQDAADASINTLATAMGAFVTREQRVRLEGHKADQQMWQAVSQVAESEPHGGA